MIKNVYDTINDLKSFLRNPSETRDTDQSIRNKTRRILGVMAINIPIMLVLMSLLLAIDKLNLISLENHKVEEFIEILPIGGIILIGVFLIPYLEELLFRLYLRFNANIPFQLLIALSGIAGKESRESIKTRLHNFWTRWFKAIFYSSALVFAFVHLTNYQYSTFLLILSPLLIAPQFVAGLFIGYLRLRFNLTTGFIMHALHNAIFLLIPLLFMSGSEEKLSIENENYSVIIEESGLRDKRVFLTDDRKTELRKTKFSKIVSYILDKEIYLIESNNNKLMNTKINIMFERKTDNEFENKTVMLKYLQEAYPFSYERLRRNVDVYEIVVTDTNLLHKSLSTNEEIGGSITITNSEISIDNGSLKWFFDELSIKYGYIFINLPDEKKRYNLSINFSDFDKIREELLEKYGLNLEKSKAEIEFLLIVFEGK